eukprot:Amastigsp_a180587_6.p2 type:complete len:107 gc:universal Amastigsp_a180587_6:192-512(+)
MSTRLTGFTCRSRIATMSINPDRMAWSTMLTPSLFCASGLAGVVSSSRRTVSASRARTASSSARLHAFWCLDAAGRASEAPCWVWSSLAASFDRMSRGRIESGVMP